MSKGSNRRPTDEKKFAENYDKIFNKKIRHPVTGEEIRYRIKDEPTKETK